MEEEEERKKMRSKRKKHFYSNLRSRASVSFHERNKSSIRSTAFPSIRSAIRRKLARRSL